jgi:ATP-binding cassette subfamily F protein 3
VLSGGERQRVALARLLLAPSNLLLLDEPTHHLDLAGKEVLEDALAQYPGAVAVVTHDRSLMARVATRVLEVNAGRVVLYPGGYDDYESTRLDRIAAAESRREPEAAGGGAGEPGAARHPDRARPADGAGARPRPRDARRGPQAAAPSASDAHATGTPPAGARPRPDRAAQNAARRRERELARLESDIAAREARQRELETALADPALYHDVARSKDVVAEYERLRAELDSLWERMAELG